MAKVLGMTYTLNTSNPWIYCNYPENVKEEYYSGSVVKTKI